MAWPLTANREAGNWVLLSAETRRVRYVIPLAAFNVSASSGNVTDSRQAWDFLGFVPTTRFVSAPHATSYAKIVFARSSCEKTSLFLLSRPTM